MSRVAGNRIYMQEAAISITFGIWYKSQKNTDSKSSRRELSIGVCMGPIGGGPVEGGLSFLDALKFCLGHFCKILNTSADS